MPSTDPKRTLATGVDDGVRLDVFDDIPTKYHGAHFFSSWLTLGDNLPITWAIWHRIPILYQNTTDNRANLLQRVCRQGALYGHQTQVLLLAKNLHRSRCKIRRDNDFAENLTDDGSQISIHGLIDHDDAAKRCLLVGHKRLLPCFNQSISTCDAARVGVFQNSHGWLLKFADQVSRCGNVDDIVKAELFTLQLLKAIEETTIERGLLVWILAVAQALHLRQLNVQFSWNTGNIAEIRLVNLTFEIFRNRAIVSRGALENLERQFAAQRSERSIIAHGSQHAIIVSGIDHDGNGCMILCCRTQHRRPTDINILDGKLEGDIGLGHGCFKRVQVHHH